MQTRCPHCETKFRVTETQVQAADGFVRCGICQEVFNAIEVAGQDKHQQPLLDPALVDTAPEEKAQAEQADVTIIEHPARDSEPGDQDTHDETAVADALQPDNSQLDSSQADNSQPDTFDFFHDDDHEPQQHVVPDKFRDTYAGSSKSMLSTVLWSIGTLLLTVTLLLEYTWFNRNQLSQVPELQTVVKRLCQVVECKEFAMRNPAKIELITRNIYSHPLEKDALMVNVTMKNNARFAQPYPVVQIDFSDIRGGTVSARRFFPEEYMPMQTDTEALHLLQPNSETTVTLEIQDPGKQAMTYEFNFL